MTFVPTPADQIPPGDVLLALLTQQASDPPRGYITPDDLATIVQALLSESYWKSEVAVFRANAADQTWTKPAGNLKTIQIIGISPGGGGGSGQRGAAGTIRCGGGGGGGGGYGWVEFDAVDVRPLLTVQVGFGGLGGTAITGDNLPGIGGTGGTAAAVFDAVLNPDAYYLQLRSGTGGGGGIGGGGAAGVGGIAPVDGGNGAASAAAGTVGLAGSSGYAAGGGSGGGLTAANAASGGGGGGRSLHRIDANIPAGGAAGLPGQNGSVGGQPFIANTVAGGQGAGGGGSAAAAIAAAGGIGAQYGAGGGGGGASANGFASGAGGAGGDGIIIIRSLR